MGNKWTFQDIANLGITRSSNFQERDGIKVVEKMKRKHQKPEQKLQIQVATYLKFKHPNVIFHSDLASGCKLTIGQAVLNKKMQHDDPYPDMFISEPRGRYHGLYLELKKNREEIYTKNGSLRNIKHIQEQQKALIELRLKGYAAEFACGYEETIKIIEDYLNIK